MSNLALFKMPKSIGLFFIFSVIPFLNNISIPHGNVASKSNTDIFSRQLSTLSEVVNHYCPRNQLEGNSTKNSVDQEYISKVHSTLNNLEIIKRCLYLSFLLRKDIITDLDRYNSFLMVLYSIMEANLSNHLTSLATKYRFPKENKEKLWKECKEGIRGEFKEVNDYYKSICKDYENTLIIAGYFFNRKLEKYIKLWKKVAYRNEKKWSDTFLAKIREYGTLTSES